MLFVDGYSLGTFQSLRNNTCNEETVQNEKSINHWKKQLHRYIS